MLKTAVLLFLFQKNPGTRDQHLHSTGLTSGPGIAGTVWTGTHSCWSNSKNKGALLQGAHSVKVPSYGMSEVVLAVGLSYKWVMGQKGQGDVRDFRGISCW